MKRTGALVLGALLAFAPESVFARSQHKSSRSRDEVRTQQSRSYRTRSSETRSNSYHRSKRDPAQRRAFQHFHSCPSTHRTSGACPSYWVDHVIPLKRGGADRPWNMQWQTVAEAKAKDKWE